MDVRGIAMVTPLHVPYFKKTRPYKWHECVCSEHAQLKFVPPSPNNNPAKPCISSPDILEQMCRLSGIFVN